MNKLNKKLNDIYNNDELADFIGKVIAVIIGVLISWKLGLIDWLLK